VTRLAKVRKTSKRIAAQLCLSVSSVEPHLAHVYQRHTILFDARRQRCGQRLLSMREATRDACDLRI
jgi:hypothetical protein